MQREETILLKTSDGSIEVSCTYIRIYMKTKIFGLIFSATIKYKKDGKIRIRSKVIKQSSQ